MQEIDFDTWYDLLLDSLKESGERRKADRLTAHEDYSEGKSPEQSDKLFLADWHPETVDD